jgi:hypothetical protein
MLFTGPELAEVIGRCANEIELRNQYGRCCRMLSPQEALALDTDLFVGIGNRRRIRFLRLLASDPLLNAGSRTTQRMNNGFGVNMAAPWIREHRAIPSTRK